VNSKAVIAAKANIIQNTGQDWKNIKLSLSTGNPTLGNTKPNLNPWTLSLSDPIVYRKARYKTQAPAAAYDKEDAPRSGAEGAQLNEVVISSNSFGTFNNSVSAAEITEVDNNQLTNAVFNISVPYNIASNGKENIVEIQQYEVAANYSYFSIPKIDNDAFLVADLIGWDKGELLSGDANVYFENNYLGTTYFDARIVDDTLSFALGRDNNITIKRKQTKDFNEKTSISGNTKKITRSFDIEVKNTRKSPIEIELEDQIPLSNNEELIIEAINTGNAEYNKETGKLTWKLKLNPAESKKLTKILNIEVNNWNLEFDNWNLTKAGHQIGGPDVSGEVLFAQIEDTEIQKQIDKLEATKKENVMENKGVESHKETTTFEDFSKYN
jgi:uncharacterized protein (TIGR02231 family)